MTTATVELSVDMTMGCLHNIVLIGVDIISEQVLHATRAAPVSKGSEFLRGGCIKKWVGVQKIASTISYTHQKIDG